MPDGATFTWPGARLVGPWKKEGWFNITGYSYEGRSIILCYQNGVLGTNLFQWRKHLWHVVHQNLLWTVQTRVASSNTVVSTLKRNIPLRYVVQRHGIPSCWRDAHIHTLCFFPSFLQHTDPGPLSLVTWSGQCSGSTRLMLAVSVWGGLERKKSCQPLFTQHKLLWKRWGTLDMLAWLEKYISIYRLIQFFYDYAYANPFQSCKH